MRRATRAQAAWLLDRNMLGRAFAFLGPVEAVPSIAMLIAKAALFFGLPFASVPTTGAERQILDDGVRGDRGHAMATSLGRSSPSLFSVGPLSNRLMAAAVAIAAPGTHAGRLFDVPPIWRMLFPRCSTPPGGYRSS